MSTEATPPRERIDDSRKARIQRVRDFLKVWRDVRGKDDVVCITGAATVLRASDIRHVIETIDLAQELLNRAKARGELMDVAQFVEPATPSEMSSIHPANPERRDSLGLSEVKPDGIEGRSGEADREGGSGNRSARSDAVCASSTERSPRATGSEANRRLTETGVGAESIPDNRYKDKPEPHSIQFNAGAEAIITLTGDGRILLRGREIANDAELVTGLREWFAYVNRDMADDMNSRNAWITRALNAERELEASRSATVPMSKQFDALNAYTERLRWRDQTRFYDKDGGRGNCLQACLASVFDLPLDAVPDFTASDPSRWMEDMKAWLAFGGYYWQHDSDNSEIPHGTLYIATGQAARGVRHSTVWKDGAMVHDPHPDKTGLVEVDGVWWFPALSSARSFR